MQEKPFFKAKTPGFLADYNLNHESEQFQYIAELHNLLHKISDALHMPTTNATDGWDKKIEHIRMLVEDHEINY